MSSTPGTAVARRDAVSPVPVMSDDEIERTWRIAKALAASRVFKDVTQAEQAFAKILLGRDLGLSAAQSMNAMDFVKGNVRLTSVTLAAFVKRSPFYDYHVDEHDETHCKIVFYSVRPDGERNEEGTSEFTIEDAKAANLVKSDSGWAKFPKNMLFARAMSNGVKWYCPDMLGGMPVYTEGDSFDRDVLAIPAEAEVVTGTVELPTEVEEILGRAHRLGHHGLADRAAAEMAIGHQPPERVAQWVAEANYELDAMEPQEQPGTLTLAEQVAELRQQADLRRIEGDNDTADELDGEADALAAEDEASP